MERNEEKRSRYQSPTIGTQLQLQVGLMMNFAQENVRDGDVDKYAHENR